MTTQVVLVEEPSAKALLAGLLPQIVDPAVDFTVLTFEGKQDLERNIPRKLSAWRAPDPRFVVLRDQDAGDCRAVRRGLVELVGRSGREALVRVACRELESWVLGDLDAVAEAWGDPSLRAHASREKFRNPDLLSNPVGELRQLVPTYQKIDGARRVGPLLRESRNVSPSFRAFCAGVRRILAA